MNCRNCGATLSYVEGKGRLRCDFCSTTHLLLEHDLSQDRVAFLSEHVDEDCPLCHQSLVKAALDHVQIRGCEECRGLLIPNEEFSQIIGRRRAEYSGPENLPEPLDSSELQRRIACPQCFGTMDTYPYCGPGNVIIDGCRTCRIIWFDHFEITAIERAPGRRLY